MSDSIVIENGEVVERSTGLQNALNDVVYQVQKGLGLENIDYAECDCEGYSALEDAVNLMIKEMVDNFKDEQCG